jgi:signal transduction histidine kinase
VRWAAAAKGIRRAQVRFRIWLADLPIDGARLARAGSALYLAGLAVVLTTAWHAPADGAAIASFPVWHLGLLMATGAGVALLTLGQQETVTGEALLAGAPAQPPATGVSQLMAQMSHELRTPLNAVIGFSEVMLAELHGPLGNARYHEYAHHISESGGRLLKSSEEALAVTEAMTALMSDRRRGRRERLTAGSLVRDAWRAAATALGGTAPHLAITTCATCDILCERRPTVQALEHLLREASGRAAAGGTVEVVGRRRGGHRSLEVRALAAPGSSPPPSPGDGTDPQANLRVILARLLLEVQGATLACRIGSDGAWVAELAFPTRR